MCAHFQNKSGYTFCYNRLEIFPDRCQVELKTQWSGFLIQQKGRKLTRFLEKLDVVGLEPTGQSSLGFAPAPCHAHWRPQSRF